MKPDHLYFPHDYQAMTDENMIALDAEYGCRGIGIYWRIVELLYQNGGEMQMDCKRIAHAIHEAEADIKNIISGFHLFIIDGGIFSSRRVKWELEQMHNLSETRRKSAKIRWDMHKQSKCNASAMQQRMQNDAEDKRREKKRGDKKALVAAPPLNVSFASFWDAYEKKVGDKCKLEKKWAGLTDGEREAVMDYIPRYKRAQPDKQYRKHPETFLNNRAWEDEIIERGNNGRGTISRRNAMPNPEDFAKL